MKKTRILQSRHSIPGHNLLCPLGNGYFFSKPQNMTHIIIIKINGRGKIIERVELIKNRYEISSFLSKGNFGLVCIGKDRITQGTVAIKFVLRSYFYGGNKKNIMYAIRSVKDDRLCKIFEFEHMFGCPIYVTELVEGKTLANLISFNPLPLLDITKYILQLTETIKKLHEKNIVHCDLNAENIMIHERTNTIKVIDFDLCVFSGEKMKCTNIGYSPPEILYGNYPATKSTDIFQIGSLMYHLITRTIPYAGHQFRKKEPVKSLMRFNPRIPKAVNDFVVNHMLAWNPCERPRSLSDVDDFLIMVQRTNL